MVSALIILMWINKSLLRQVLRRGHRTSITSSTYNLVSVLHFQHHRREVQMGPDCQHFLPMCVTKLPAELRVTANLCLLLPGTTLDQASNCRNTECLSGWHSILSVRMETTVQTDKIECKSKNQFLELHRYINYKKYLYHSKVKSSKLGPL